MSNTASEQESLELCVMVNKRDGTLRFTIDYRQLNVVTKRDDYSLQDPQSIFDKLTGFPLLQWMSRNSFPQAEGDVRNAVLYWKKISLLI